MKTIFFKFSATLLSLFFVFGFSLIGFSQEKKHEIGIGTGSLNQFSIRYKFGNENRMFRVTYTNLSVENTKISTNTENTSFDMGIGLGVEYPKIINDKLALYYGCGILSSFGKTFKINSQKYKVGFRGILGFAYYFNDVLKLGAEITPGVFYSYSEDGSYTTKEFGVGFHNNYAQLCLGFEF